MYCLEDYWESFHHRLVQFKGNSLDPVFSLKYTNKCSRHKPSSTMNGKINYKLAAKNVKSSQLITMQRKNGRRDDERSENSVHSTHDH